MLRDITGGGLGEGLVGADILPVGADGHALLKDDLSQLQAEERVHTQDTGGLGRGDKQ